MQGERQPVPSFLAELNLSRSRLLAIGLVGVALGGGALAVEGSDQAEGASAQPSAVPAAMVESASALATGEAGQAFDNVSPIPQASLSANDIRNSDKSPVCDPIYHRDKKKLAFCKWVVTGVESVPGTRAGSPNYCIGFDRAPGPQTVTCSIAKSKATTVTAEVGGSAPVGDSALTAQVGYDVTKTSTVTGSDSFYVHARSHAGELDWFPVFKNLKEVTQQYATCFVGYPIAKNSYCQPSTKPLARNVATATVEQYKGIKVDIRYYSK